MPGGNYLSQQMTVPGPVTWMSPVLDEEPILVTKTPICTRRAAIAFGIIGCIVVVVVAVVLVLVLSGGPG